MSGVRGVWRGVAAGLAVLVAAVVVVAAAAVVVVVRRPLPDHDADLRLAGLSATVDVTRDARGVPTITADSIEDLYFAQGFVTAQDRFFEMDVRRHIAAGRLSELVGADDDALTADRVVRTLGWRRTAEAEARTLGERERRILDSYSAGVNAYLSGRSPGQIDASYTVLSLQVPLPAIERWTAADSLAWLKAVAWELSSNRTEEATRALLLAHGLSTEQVAQYLPPYPGDQPTIVEGAPAPAVPPAGGEATAAVPAAAAPALASALAAVRAVPTSLSADEATGSNSWVLSGRFTASGSPLLANDPHLAPSAPSVWYQVGLRCRQVGEQCPVDVSGFSFSGVPGILIGRNDRIAWGLTTLYADDADYYLEDVEGDRYRVGDRQRPLAVSTETIEVAGADPVPLTIRRTGHGPLLSDVLDTVAELGSGQRTGAGGDPRYAVSLAWTGLEPATTFEALVSVNLARDWATFRQAASLLDVPGQNLVYADVEGHIGYQTPGRIPVRGAGDGLLPAPGWDPAYDWQGEVPFERLPSVLDPARGYIVTANNRVTSDPGAPYLGSDTRMGFRAARIEERLAALAQRGSVAPEDMAAVQLDEVSPLSTALVPYLVDVPGVDDFTRQAVDLLPGWDGRVTVDSAPAAYVQAVWRRLLEGLFDEVPEEARTTGGGRTIVAVSALLADPTDAWWDDSATEDVVETRDDILRAALTRARLDLTSALGKDPGRWRWDRLHTLELRQLPLGAPSVPAPIRRLVNLGPVGLAGSNDVVDASSWDASSGSFEAVAVPSLRMTVDLGSPDAGRWVITTGESGHPGSRHYGDQLDAWAQGRTYPWPFTAPAVDAAARNRTTLRPPG